MYVWLLTLVCLPALVALMLVMAWLEDHLVGRLAADDIAAALQSINTYEDLEQVVAQASAPLFTRVR